MELSEGTSTGEYASLSSLQNRTIFPETGAISFVRVKRMFSL
jgi:hypothetical protein